MPPTDGSLSATGRGPVRDRLDRLRSNYDAAPLPLKLLIVAVCCIIGFPIAIVLAPYAIISGSRSSWATGSVTIVGIALVSGLAHGAALPRYTLFVLPIVVAFISSVGALGRWYAPCRTVAWTLPLALLPGIAVFRLLDGGTSFIGPGVAWLLAAIVVGWRLAKALQDSRQGGRPQQLRGGPVPPANWVAGQSGQPRNGGPRPGPGSGNRPGGRSAPSAGRPTDADGRIMTAARSGRVGPVVPVGSAPLTNQVDRSAADQPVITVEEAMAELDAMIGLAAVKDQVRSIAASVEAARRRALAGIGADKPMQHFVFLGPPGTGKTAVARIVAKIFYAFGLLDVPNVVEVQRSDLVGEYLGATAIKTNELIDSALGGVLFIDEAYSLVNDGDGQNDRFGNEAVQVLLKRAEDDRDRLIIILAGYERQMETFLASNPGLTSRFAVRIKFGGYSPAELLELADLSVARRGEIIDPQARSVLWRMFEEVGRRRLGDELGNGRFVRSLLERAGQARDVRVMAGDSEPGRHRPDHAARQ